MHLILAARKKVRWFTFTGRLGLCSFPGENCYIQTYHTEIYSTPLSKRPVIYMQIMTEILTKYQLITTLNE